jgi:hypothetical protein
MTQLSRRPGHTCRVIFNQLSSVLPGLVKSKHLFRFRFLDFDLEASWKTWFGKTAMAELYALPQAVVLLKIPQHNYYALNNKL